MSTDRLADRRGPVAHQLALRDYDRLKMELAGIIRSVKQLAADRKDKEKSEECRSLLVRLAEDRFNLAVVGEFSRGKTSLMNALLGMDRLPVGVLRLTSVVTTGATGITNASSSSARAGPCRMRSPSVSSRAMSRRREIPGTKHLPYIKFLTEG